MSAPFNEDHPDFERLVQGVSRSKNADDELVLMVSTAIPVHALHFLLEDEKRGARHQLLALWVTFATWALWHGWSLFEPDIPRALLLAMSLLLTVALVLQFSAVRNRRLRTAMFIEPALDMVREIEATDRDA